MAGEKQTSISFRVGKSNLSVSDTLSLSETLAGSDFYAKSWIVTTAAAPWLAIPLDALASFDLLFIKNTDATNFVQVALDNAGAQIFAKLTPGRGMLLPPNTSTLYWKADTASCVCNVIAVEP